MKWNTKLMQLFPGRLQLPIMGAPMADVSGGKLAAETCRAGAMGFLASGHLHNEKTRQTLEHEIQEFRQQASQSSALLAIGFIGHSLCFQQLQQVLQEQKPDVVQFFAPAIRYDTNTKSNVAMAQEYGAKVMAQVGTIADAQEALKAGVDVIICQGSPEAGGHGVRLDVGTGTLSLVRHVVSMVEDKPIAVVAAGGIVDGRGLVAALALGCDGVSLGTRLWASKEAMGPDTLKQALVEASSPDDVVRSVVFDAIANTYSATPWPKPFDSSGTLRNRTTEEYEHKGEALLQELQNKGAEHSLVSRYKEGNKTKDPSITAVYAGKGVGQIQSIDGAYDIITRIEQEAVDIIETQLGGLLIKE